MQIKLIIGNQLPHYLYGLPLIVCDHNLPGFQTDY